MNRILTYVLIISGILVAFAGIVQAQSQDVVNVTATPLWTNTGLHINIDDNVEITASGSWTWGGGYWHGPDGQFPWNWPNTWDRFLYQARHGELIAFVGQDPYQGHWGDKNFFPQTTGYWRIESNGQFISDKTGILWLGFNDDAASRGIGDNAGIVTAQIFVTPPAIIIPIDIKPGSDPNSININSRGVIPVAILTTDEFNAQDVNAETVRFGPSGAYAEQYALEDVDDDGYIDLILHFRTRDAGIAPEDTQAVLTGETREGQRIEGSDTVRVLERKGGKK